MRPLALAIALAAGLLATPALAEDPLTAWSGVFTEEQAARGETEYAIWCAMCHGQDLVATDGEATDLTGVHFDFFWVDEPLVTRFAYIKAMKPEGNPGSFEDQAVLDMVAYILAFNGYPAGDTELTPDSPLAEIVITAEP